MVKILFPFRLRKTVFVCVFFASMSVCAYCLKNTTISLFCRSTCILIKLTFDSHNKHSYYNTFALGPVLYSGFVSCFMCKYGEHDFPSVFIIFFFYSYFFISGRRRNKKIQVGNDQEKAQSERNSHSKNRGGEKTKLTIREHIVSRVSSYVPIGGHSITRT